MAMRRVSESEQAQIRTLWAASHTLKEIGRIVGCSPTTASRYVAATGVDVRAVTDARRSTTSPAIDAEIVRRYLAGESTLQLAEAFGFSGAFMIVKRLRKAGVATRNRGQQRRIFTDDEVARIVKRHDEGWPVYAIAGDLGCDHRVVARWLVENGHRNPWYSGIRKLNDGYVGQWVPAGHPLRCMANREGVIRLHRLVMAEAIGRPLRAGETVHHINGDRADNRIENLQLRVGNHGPGAAIGCLDCGSHRIGHVAIAEPQTEMSA